jgi:hypothetical protein
MAEGDEIKQRITVDADEAKRNLADVSAAQEKLAESIEDSAATAQQAAGVERSRQEVLAELRDRLEELVRQELAHEQSVARGGAADDTALNRATERRTEIERLSQRLGEEKAVQDRVNASIREHAGASGQATGEIAAMTGAVEGLIARYTTFAAVGQTIIKTLTEIRDVAMSTVDAMQQLGEQQRALSVNLGGERAAGLSGQVTKIAAQNMFGVAGRNQLLEAVGAVTNRVPDMSDAQITEMARHLAVVQRTTGVGGRQGVDVLLGLQQNLGVSTERATDMAVTMLSAGMDAGAIAQITQRAGAAGGEDALALLMAGREEGLDVNKVGRQLPTLIQSLTARDQRGKLDRGLRRAGVTEEMDLVQRFEQIIGARDEGRISAGQFEQLIGGAQNLGVVEPLGRALKSGAFERARGELRDDQAAERAVQAVQENPVVAAAERQAQRELMQQVRRERPSAFGEAMQQAEHESDYFIGRVGAKVARGTAALVLGDRANVSHEDVNLREINRSVDQSLGDLGIAPAPGAGAAPQTVIQNQTVIHVDHQYNLNTDGTSRLSEDPTRADVLP